MSVAFDAASSVWSDVFVQTVTLSHTIGAGANYLIAGISADDFTNTTDLISGVTWNGVAMARIIQGPTNRERAELWGLTAPTTGTHDLVVTYFDPAPPEWYSTIAAISFSGVDQTTPIGATGSDQYTSSFNPTLTMSLGANDMAVDVVTCGNHLLTASGTGQTRRWVAGTSFAGDGEGSTTISATGSATTFWSDTSPNPWFIVGVVLRALANRRMMEIF